MTEGHTCHQGPRGLGLLPSEGEGSRDDPPSSHIRFHLGLSVFPSSWGAADCSPILGRGSGFPVSAGCSHSHALPRGDLASLALTEPRLTASWARAHTQQARGHRAKSGGPAHLPHFYPLPPAPCLLLPLPPLASSLFKSENRELARLERFLGAHCVLPIPGRDPPPGCGWGLEHRGFYQAPPGGSPGSQGSETPI